MKRNIYIKIACLFAMALGAGSCSDWLDPRPLSIYTGDNAFEDYNALKTALPMLDRDLRYLEYYPPSLGIDPFFITELIFSDVAVNGRTDTSNSPQDMNQQITPSANLNSGTNMARCHGYWTNLYKGLKDANTVISRSATAKFDNESQRNEILAYGYFHRAMRYYRLVHQFGDVPLILEEVTEPRYDFYSTKREVTLRQMKADLEATVEFLPDRPSFGAVGKGAVYHLLTKINLALCEFDDAIESAGKVIDGGVHSLMKTRFGVDANDATKNIIWDLHRNENKAIASNTEVLYLLIDRYGETAYQTTAGLETMRQVTPWYMSSGKIQTPDGKAAFVDNDEVKNPYLAKYGRGICTARSTWYHTNTIWEPATSQYNDLRHDTISGNWVMMENLAYNNPNLAPGGTTPSPWYGKRLKKKDENLSDDENRALGAAVYNFNDSTRIWVDWPHYKVYVPDQKTNWWRGGWGDWYVFRVAETHLLRAEAYVWKGRADLALTDINEVRERAGARPLNANEVSIRAILDERARELFYEEPRKTELTRISYIYATTGMAADNGKSYSLNNFSENNFFFDHISEVNNFYNKGAVTITGNKYTMSPRHVLWPISERDITINVQGRINQNKGYPGAENNIEPLDRPN